MGEAGEYLLFLWTLAVGSLLWGPLALFPKAGEMGRARILGAYWASELTPA